MRFLELLLMALGLTGLVHDRPSPSPVRRDTISTLDAYITKEARTARSSLLANIGPDGAQSHGALVRTPLSIGTRDVLMTVICFTGRFGCR